MATKAKHPRKTRTGSVASVAQWLIDAAEDLFGVYGLQGAFLRQICAAAGTSNNGAVQYHFGDVHGLIDAIIAKRSLSIERTRHRILTTLKSRNEVCSESLIDALLWPMINHLNDEGERTLARFAPSLFSDPGSL
jgi:AcrR family transcriptional regulator